MPTDCEGTKVVRSKIAALLHFTAWVLIAQKLYPLIVRRGEFVHLPWGEALQWLASLPSVVIFCCVAALTFAINVKPLQRVNFFGLLLSAVIVAIVGSELLFPYDLIHAILPSPAGQPMEWVILVALCLSALLAPRVLSRWLV